MLVYHLLILRLGLAFEKFQKETGKSIRELNESGTVRDEV
jgi:hypothetical protein